MIFYITYYIHTIQCTTLFYILHCILHYIIHYSTRQKGWRRMVLFGLTFNPSGIEVLDLVESVKLTEKVPTEMKKLVRIIL